MSIEMLTRAPGGAPATCSPVPAPECPVRPAAHRGARLAGAGDLEGQHLAQRSTRMGLGQLPAAAAEALEILLGQVDTPRGEILGHILTVLAELQAGADRARQGYALGSGRAEPREHQLADGVGRERAVAAQLLPGPVAVDALIHAVGLDQA